MTLNQAKLIKPLILLERVKGIEPSLRFIFSHSALREGGDNSAGEV
jgi:restriction endonuclease